MARRAEPPTSALYAAQESIQQLGTDPNSAEAVELYGADIGDLASGRGLSALKSVGWRWLVPGEKRWTAVDVYLDDSGKPLGRPQRQRGEFVDDLVRVLHESDSERPAEDESSDIGVVEIPELNFSSVWMPSAAKRDAGILITLSPIATYGRHTRLKSDVFNALVADLAKYQIRVDLDHASVEEDVDAGSSSGSSHGGSSVADAIATLVREGKKALDRLRQTEEPPGPVAGAPGGSSK